nr:hypothetical protein [Proteus mirabilis]
MSSSLSEIALLDFDEKILRNQNIIYYGRFVDDIIIITDNPLFFNKIPNTISPYNLNINKSKSQLITLNTYSEHSTLYLSIIWVIIFHSLQITIIKQEKKKKLQNSCYKNI